MINLQEHDKWEVDYDKRYDHLSLVEWSKPMDNTPWGYYASYKIGAEWVDEHETLVVTTKKGMERIDFLDMFLTCFSSDLALDSFSKIYTIDFEQKPIPAPSLRNVVSPLIVLHFLGVVCRIKTLKRGYVHRSDNLKKVKGRIDVMRNERRNVIVKRYNRVYCNYDEYSVDIPENRLLKKALLFSQRFLRNMKGLSCSFDKVMFKLAQSLCLFESVSDEVQINEVCQIKSHVLFKEYAEAVRLAKQILRRFDYSISRVDEAEENIIPFVLDMSLLYEHYVYGLLKEAYEEKIEYQFKGKTGYPDFLYRSFAFKAILDTKYIPKYDENSLDTYVVRQLSGYSRDLKVLRRLGMDNIDEESLIPNVPCIIIYPKEDGVKINPFLERKLENLCTEKVKNLSRFYKIAIPIPTIGDATLS